MTDTNNEELQAAIYSLPVANETDLAIGDGISVKMSDLIKLFTASEYIAYRESL